MDYNSILKTMKELDEILSKANKNRQKEDVSMEYDFDQLEIECKNNFLDYLKDVIKKIDKSFTYNVIFQRKGSSDLVVVETNYDILIEYFLKYSMGEMDADKSFEAVLSTFPSDMVRNYWRIKRLLYQNDLKYILFDDSVVEIHNNKILSECNCIIGYTQL